jgi:hypothetical protein
MPRHVANDFEELSPSSGPAVWIARGRSGPLGHGHPKVAFRIRRPRTTMLKGMMPRGHGESATSKLCRAADDSWHSHEQLFNRSRLNLSRHPWQTFRAMPAVMHAKLKPTPALNYRQRPRAAQAKCACRQHCRHKPAIPALRRCGTAHGALATCAKAAAPTQQTPGYSTRTQHRQMMGRVIGFEVVRYERATDYSVMHRSANAAAKVTAKAIPQALTADRAPGMRGREWP